MYVVYKEHLLNGIIKYLPITLITNSELKHKNLEVIVDYVFISVCSLLQITSRKIVPLKKNHA